MKKLILVCFCIFTSSFLYGCNDSDYDELNDKLTKFISNGLEDEVEDDSKENNGESKNSKEKKDIANVFDLNGTPVKDVVLDGKLEFVGLKLYERFYEDNYMDKTNFKISDNYVKTEYVRVYKDTATGCHYIIDTEDVWLPLYGIEGEVEGCYKNSANISVENDKSEMIRLLKESYSDKDNDELEYILVNIFNYPNLSVEDLKIKLKLLSNEFSGVNSKVSDNANNIDNNIDNNNGANTGTDTKVNDDDTDTHN